MLQKVTPTDDSIMPIPPALLARLQRRGLVREQSPQEEVIAESYDDDTIVKTRGQSSQKSAGCPGCPNKFNPFHLCSEYCWDHWGEGVPEENLDPESERKRNRMLRKYPLPSNWKEVYDPGVSRYYYWNQETDEVSWLSPSHPRAVIGEAASKLAKAVFDKIERARTEKLMKETAAEEETSGRRKRRHKPPPVPQPSDSESEEEKEEGSRNKKRKKLVRKGLDPMDPASYGECDVGSWSSGLDTRGEAVTGADTTASGPLFQMRPYPSPGAILKKNAGLKK